MRPPFSRDEFLAVFARYNDATFPTSVILMTVAVLVLLIALRNARAAPVLLGFTGLLWLWMAVAYHAAFFATLTPLGFVFALMFLGEGMMIVHAARNTRRTYQPIARVRAVVAAMLIAYALVGYPILGYLAGQRYPSFPTFGLPCPTTIFTLGVFAWFGPAIPRAFFMIPALWAIVGTSAALLFAVVEDLALLPAVALAILPQFSVRQRATIA